MKIILTKYDTMKILMRHFDISEYVDLLEEGKRIIKLHQNEIYWEGNPKPEKKYKGRNIERV